jgi:hypothetical protein
VRDRNLINMRIVHPHLLMRAHRVHVRSLVLAAVHVRSLVLAAVHVLFARYVRAAFTGFNIHLCRRIYSVCWPGC